MARRRSASARRRASAQASKLGEEVRIGRASNGMSVQQVAQAAGAAWQTVARLEAGDPTVSILTACAIGEAAGVDVVVRAYPGRTPSLRDSGQLELTALLTDSAHAAWRSTTELMVGPNGEAIDIAFFGATEIIATEIERRLADWQGQRRRAETKRAALAGRHQRPVRLVIAIEDTPRNRRLLAPHRELVARDMPANSREIRRVLLTGQPLGRDGILWVRRRRR